MKIFRDNVFKKLSDPEDLNGYIKVSTPSAWLITIGALFFVVGVCVWMFFGVINTKIDTTVVANDGVVQAIVERDDMQKIQKNMKVKVSGNDFEVARVGDFDDKINGYRVFINGNMENGVYPAEIILKSVRPIDFFAN